VARELACAERFTPRGGKGPRKKYCSGRCRGARRQRSISPAQARRRGRQRRCAPELHARPFKTNELEERLMLGLGPDDGGLVFAEITGEPVNPDNFTRKFARLVKRSKIRPVTFHGLRDTHVTNPLREGVHPTIASERAGHASVSITLDLYSHAVRGLQQDAAQRIDAALRKALAGC
jgi:integrase